MNEWKLNYKDLYVCVTLKNGKKFMATTSGFYDPVQRKATILHLYAKGYRQFSLSRIKSLRFFPTYFWDTEIGLKLYKESLDIWLKQREKNQETIIRKLYKKYKVTKKQRGFNRSPPNMEGINYAR